MGESDLPNIANCYKVGLVIISGHKPCSETYMHINNFSALKT